MTLLQAIINWFVSLLNFNKSVDPPAPLPYNAPQIVLDISHHNSVTDFRALKEAGVVGIIFKATQGVKEVDPRFHEYIQDAKALGFLVGAYHFGTGDNVQAQVDHFLTTIKPYGGILRALDYEKNPNGLTMNLHDARFFVTKVQAETGSWPKFYSSNLIKDQLGQEKDNVLSNCLLWLAEYGSIPKAQATWKTQWL